MGGCWVNMVVNGWLKKDELAGLWVWLIWAVLDPSEDVRVYWFGV